MVSLSYNPPAHRTWEKCARPVAQALPPLYCPIQPWADALHNHDPMPMTAFEKLLMNNRLRCWQQANITLPAFAKLGAALAGARVLEPGCGHGVGAELLIRRSGARQVDAFDVDARQLRRAKARATLGALPIQVWRGDIQRIAVRSNVYDAVVCFGVLHHADNWRQALRELHRVLRPGGQLCLEESYAGFILHPFWRRLMAHPTQDRFSGSTLLRELESVGFESIAEQHLADAFGLVVCRKRTEAEPPV